MKTVRNEKGVSLLEVMIAMIILAFGVLGLAPMIVVSMYGNSFSNQVTAADAIALDWLEEIKSWSMISPIPYTQTIAGVSGMFTRQTQVDDITFDDGGVAVVGDAACHHRDNHRLALG